MWISSILISSLLLSVYDLARKQSVQDNAVMPVLFLATVFGLLFVTALFAVTGSLVPAVTGVTGIFFLRVLFKALLVSGSWVAMFYAMRALPISVAAPIRASAPVWTLFGAVLLYGEIPSWARACGIVCVLIGYWLFSLAGKVEGLSFRRHKGLWLCMAATLLGAASALYDKHLLQVCAMDRDAMQFWFSLLLVAVLGLVLAGQRLAGLHQTRFRWCWTIPVVGVVLMLADWFYFRAVSDPSAAISVLSLIRRSGVVFTFIIGGTLFREKNLAAKACALAAILLGVAILCLAK